MKTELQTAKEEIGLLKMAIALADSPAKIEEYQKRLIIAYEYYSYLLGDKNVRAA